MNVLENVPTRPGTYLLHLSCDQAGEVDVGRLGTMKLRPGNYLYTGSAHGPGGLRARLGHHLRLATRPHWHLDYLRQHCMIDRIWFSTAPEADECLWASAAKQIRGCSEPFAAFGSSDCRCSSHLLWRARSPVLQTFRQALRRSVKRHGAIRTVLVS